nr:eukaryotic translation initiation factor 4E-binding protein 2 [Vicugna pacos]
MCASSPHRRLQRVRWTMPSEGATEEVRGSRLDRTQVARSRAVRVDPLFHPRERSPLGERRPPPDGFPGLPIPWYRCARSPEPARVQPHSASQSRRGAARRKDPLALQKPQLVHRCSFHRRPAQRSHAPSAAGGAPQPSQSRAIPTRTVPISDAAQLPHDYCTTPGGTLFSTTPGGTRIIYDRKFLLDRRNSPMAQTPPCHLPNIPGVTSPGTLIEDSKVEVNNLNNLNNHDRKHAVGDDAQFEMDI